MVSHGFPEWNDDLRVRTSKTESWTISILNHIKPHGDLGILTFSDILTRRAECLGGQVGTKNINIVRLRCDGIHSIRAMETFHLDTQHCCKIRKDPADDSRTESYLHTIKTTAIPTRIDIYNHL